MMASKLLLIGSLLGSWCVPAYSNTKLPRVCCTPGDDDIYQFHVTLLDKLETISFEKYRGKVLLILNTATYWGLTVSSYKQINALADYYKDQDFEILGFPSNEFGLQEPGRNYEEIFNGVKYVRPGGGFEPKLTYFQKVNTNGEKEAKIYTFLKSSCPYVDEMFSDHLFYSPIKVGDVRWNFEKFLVGRDGKVHARFHPQTTDPEALKLDIDTLLDQPY